MVGNRIGYGEDTALLGDIATRCPGQLYYDPRLYVYNVVRADQMTVRYGLRASFAAGIAAQRVYRSGDRRRVGHLQLLKQEVRTSVVGAVKLALSVIWRDRQQYPFIQNYMLEASANYLRELGELYEQHRRLFKGRDFGLVAQRSENVPDSRIGQSEP
jgi:hypothetical protein